MGTCLVYIGMYANKILKILLSRFAHSDAQKNSVQRHELSSGREWL